MNKFLKTKKLSYSFVPLFILFVFSLSIQLVSAQQGIQIRGKVTDAKTGEEIIGANIIQVGTTNGTTTGIDGNFSLNAPPNSMLRISSIGYISQEIPTPANQNTQLNIRLVEDTQLLAEVVVVGYGTQKKSEITAAVASLTEENFNQTVATQSALELAQGRIPGLLISSTSAGDPRGQTYIQIRGTASLRGNTSPLIVIDGIPGGSLDLIPPEDITNISVLKDASAAAIYGTRGANGVILVTTKRGRSATNDLKSTFDYSSTISHQYLTKKPRVLTAQEYREYMESGDYLSGSMVDHGYDTDWMDLLTNNNNISHTHNLSMRGGNQTSNYRATIYYRTFDPVMIEMDRTNWGARANINHLGLNDRLEVQINMNADFSDQNELGTTDMYEQAAQRNPTLRAFDDNGKVIEDAAYNSTNPVGYYKTREDQRSRANWMLSQTSSLTVMEGLRAIFMTAWTQYNDTRNQYREKNSKSSLDSYSGGGYAQKWSEKRVRQVMELRAEYNKIINDIHGVNVVAGHAYEYFYNETFNAFNTGFITDGFKYNDLGSGTGRTSGNGNYHGMSSAKNDNRLASFFGRISYTLKDKYLFQAVLRLDGSSKFGANNRWGKFPAISAGWILSEEKFMKDFKFINYLKLRAGYGITGNPPGSDTTDNNLYMTTYSSRDRQLIGTNWTALYGPSRNPNADLKWEEKREWNVGLEFTLMKNRLQGTLEFYRRLTVDIIDSYNAQQPPYVLNSMWANVGTMSNTGVEIGLSFKAINTRNLRWDVSTTFTRQKNVLESLSNDLYKATYRSWQGLPSPGALGDAFRTEEGQATGSFYGKRFAGFDKEGKWLFYKKDGSVAPLSQMTTEDLTIIGNGNPAFQASLNNSLKYKNWDFTMLMRGRFNFDILNLQEMYFGNRTWFSNNVLKSAITTHKELKDAPQYSDYYLEDGTFWKISDVTLGYTFNIKNRTWLRSARVYGSINGNVYTFTKYKGQNPELRDSGFVVGYDGRSFTPANASMVFGINIGF